MDDLIKSVRAEEQRLVAELQQNATYLRLEAVRGLLKAYGWGQAPVAAKGAPTPSRGSSSHSAEPRARHDERGWTGSDSLTARVERAAATYLSEIGRRAQSPEILDVLLKQGFEFPDDKPIRTLASILSHSPRFNNLRGAGNGYGLISWPINRSGDLSLENHMNQVESETSSDQTPTGVNDELGFPGSLESPTSMD